jgi:hypothetical protein
LNLLGGLLAAFKFNLLPLPFLSKSRELFKKTLDACFVFVSVIVFVSVFVYAKTDLSK